MCENDLKTTFFGVFLPSVFTGCCDRKSKTNIERTLKIRAMLRLEWRKCDHHGWPRPNSKTLVRRRRPTPKNSNRTRTLGQQHKPIQRMAPPIRRIRPHQPNRKPNTITNRRRKSKKPRSRPIPKIHEPPTKSRTNGYLFRRFHANSMEFERQSQ